MDRQVPVKGTLNFRRPIARAFAHAWLMLSYLYRSRLLHMDSWVVPSHMPGCIYLRTAVYAYLPLCHGMRALTFWAVRSILSTYWCVLYNMP